MLLCILWIWSFVYYVSINNKQKTKCSSLVCEKRPWVQLPALQREEKGMKEWREGGREGRREEVREERRVGGKMKEGEGGGREEEGKKSRQALGAAFLFERCPRPHFSKSSENK